MRNINGISLSSMVTPIGVVYRYLGEYLPAGTALLLNLIVIAPVYQLPARATSSLSRWRRPALVRSIGSLVRSALTTALSGITVGSPVSLPISPLPFTAAACSLPMTKAIP